MNEDEMKRRTKQFALGVLKVCDALPRTVPADVLKRQVVRSGAGVAAGYRAVCRAKSSADFLYKLSVAEEEADETALWLELMSESGMLPPSQVQDLLAEANALTAILVRSQQTVRNRQAIQNPESKTQKRP